MPTIRNLILDAPGYRDSDERNGFVMGLDAAGLDLSLEVKPPVPVQPDMENVKRSDVVRVLSDVMALSRAGSFIEAIKALRGLTGLGLKESKDVVDAIRFGVEPRNTPR